VQSKDNPDKKYVVWWYGDRFGDAAFCGCEDWFRGNGVQRFGFDSSQPHAPFVPGLGVACKHLLAAWIYQRVTSMYTCPACNGDSFHILEENWQLYPQTGVRIKVCDVCEARGVIFDQEIVIALTEPGPMPTVETTYINP
jgi:hypothetical protein